MPNWCSNVVTLMGRKEEIQRFITMSQTVPEHYKTHGYDTMTEGEFSFNGTVPMPEKIVKEMMPDRIKADKYMEWMMAPEAERKGPQPSREYDRDKAELWYGWNNSHWGTKWDPDIALAELEGDDFCFRFDSAWAPPLLWMQAASVKFPELQFHIWYEELGMMFYGEADAQEGSISDECWQIDQEYLNEHHPDFAADFEISEEDKD